MTDPKYAVKTPYGRQYTNPNNDRRYWSVTWAIGNGIPKHALKKWGEITVAGKAFDERAWVAQQTDRELVVAKLKTAPYDITSHAAERGTNVHREMERIANGEVVKAHPFDEITPWLDSGRLFIEEFRPEFKLSEVTVYSDRYGYAGSLDFIARFLAAPWMGNAIGDYKTGNGIYAEVGPQLAAYRFADYYIDDNGRQRKLPQIDSAFAVHLTADGYSVLPIDAGETSFEAFLHALGVAKWSVEERSKVVSPAMRPDMAHPWDFIALHKRIFELPLEGQLRLQNWARAKGVETQQNKMIVRDIEAVLEATRRLELEYRDQPTDTGKVEP